MHVTFSHFLSLLCSSQSPCILFGRIIVCRNMLLWNIFISLWVLIEIATYSLSKAISESLMQGSRQWRKPYWHVNWFGRLREIIKVHGAVRIVESMLQYFVVCRFKLSHSSLTEKAPGQSWMSDTSSSLVGSGK